MIQSMPGDCQAHNICRRHQQHGLVLPFSSACPNRPTPKTTSDVADKSEALDRERLEVACLRQNIIDDYEKKSTELLKYLNSMECAFDHQRSQYNDREANLRRENDKLRHELQHGCRSHVAELLAKEQEREQKAQEVVQAVQLLKSEMKEKERIAQKEHKKSKELQEVVEELQLMLEKKEEEHESVQRREARLRKTVEDENNDLRRKAALGWMLGCLSELYMKLDPEIFRTGGIMKLVRKVQRELEAGNHVFTTGASGAMPPELEYELIQREIRRLISATSGVPDLDLEHPENVVTEKLRSTASMLRTSKARDFTGELPGDRRRKLRECQKVRQRVAAMHGVSTPPSQMPMRREPTSFQPSTPHDQPKQKHHISSYQDVPRRSCSETRVCNMSPKQDVPLMDADHAARSTKQLLKIKKTLQGLESSMTYLLGQERRRHLYNHQRI